MLARAGMTREKLQVILARQTPDAAKRARADYVVETEAFSPARAGLARCLTLALALALALTLTLTLTLTLALALTLTLTLTLALTLTLTLTRSPPSRTPSA